MVYQFLTFDKNLRTIFSKLSKNLTILKNRSPQNVSAVYTVSGADRVQDQLLTVCAMNHAFRKSMQRYFDTQSDEIIIILHKYYDTV